mmetsp:Transcript_16947/g.42558  ORF Transcript_16947/g.42558 Transcript_16947/m.42558 type:complete len:204 (-) Transcript_16947:29-640(-)
MESATAEQRLAERVLQLESENEDLRLANARMKAKEDSVHTSDVHAMMRQLRTIAQHVGELSADTSELDEEMTNLTHPVMPSHWFYLGTGASAVTLPFLTSTGLRHLLKNHPRFNTDMHHVSGFLYGASFALALWMVGKKVGTAVATTVRRRMTWEENILPLWGELRWRVQALRDVCNARSEQPYAKEMREALRAASLARGRRN